VWPQCACSGWAIAPPPSGVSVGMIVGSPVILGDEMDVSDAALTNLSFIVCSFWYVVGWSRWVLADLFGLLICLTFSGLELFHAS